MKNVARALSNPDGLEVVGIMFVVGKNGLDFEPLQVRDKKIVILSFQILPDLFLILVFPVFFYSKLRKF